MSAVGPTGDGDSDGDINAFWQARNYNLDVGNVHAAVFESQGLNDDNVRPNHFAQWWAGLTAHNVPRKLWLSQEGHVDPFDYRRSVWVDTLHRWFDHWLYGLPNGIMQEPKIDIETGPNTWTTARAWPLQQTRPVGVYLQGTTAGAKGVLALRSGGGTSSLTFTDANLSETNYLSLTNTQANKLTFLSPPLKHDLRISGTPVVDIRASLSKTQSNLSAFLVDYGGGVLRVFRTSNEGVQNLTTRSCWGDSTAADSSCYLDVIERTTTPTSWRVGKGLLDSSNRDSLFSGDGTPVTIGQTYEFKWPLLPNDFTFVAGHQLGVILGANFSGYGSVNGTTGTAITVDTKLSKMILPITGGRAAARRVGRLRREPGREDQDAGRRRRLPARQGRPRVVQVQERRDDDRLVRRHGAERRGDRHVHAGLAHVHGDGDRRGRHDDDRDDALHGHRAEITGGRHEQAPPERPLWPSRTRLRLSASVLPSGTERKSGLRDRIDRWPRSESAVILTLTLPVDVQPRLRRSGSITLR